MKEAYERRALLLHLGSVLHAASQIAQRKPGAVSASHWRTADDLAQVLPWLEHLSPRISGPEFVTRALQAFRTWPEALLALPLDHAKLAEPVREHLFAGNPRGWQAYVSTLRADVPWFGEGIGAETSGESGSSAQTLDEADTGEREDEANEAPDSGETEAADDGAGGVEGAGGVGSKRGSMEGTGEDGQNVERQSPEGQAPIYPSWPWKPGV